MRSQRVRFLSIALLALLLTSFGAARAEAATSVPLSGSFTDATGLVGSYTGTFTIQKFGQKGGQLVAIGTVTATLFDLAGNIIRTITKTGVVIPVTGITGTCEILHLELGPLDLDLLGLVIHLDKVVLDISAEAGAGNLLGNLLCAIAGLLDAGGPLSHLVNLLNQLVGLLG